MGGSGGSTPDGTWAALVAGAAPWSTERDHADACQRLVLVLELFALGIVITTVWRSASIADVAHGTVASVVCTVAVLAFMVGPVLRLLDREPLSRSVPVNLVVRGTLMAAATLSLTSVLHGWGSLLLASVAVAIGADATITMSALGWQPRPLRWWIDFVLSPFHLGVIGGFVALIVRSRTTAATAVPFLVALHVCVAIVICVSWVVVRVLDIAAIDRAAVVAAVKQDERRRRAHWLHDDVCAKLRLVSLKIQTANMSRDHIVALLDDLDHQLRLRQLGELVEAGDARAAEVLQPYIRHAQNLGIEIAAVPGYEQAATQLNESEAHLLARAAAVLTSNALNAGSTELSYMLEARDDLLELTVSDNGPGFALDAVPPGRGLWSLHLDLAPGGIDVHPSPAGSRVTATIPLERRTRGGDHPSR